MANTVVKMPQLGESVAEGTIGRWLKQPGDRVERDEPLVEIQTDKVNAEVASPVAGILQRILLQEGATAAVKSDMAIIGDEPPTDEPPQLVGDPSDVDSVTPTSPPAFSYDPAEGGGVVGHRDAEPARQPEPEGVPTSEGGSAGKRFYTPVVLRMAEEHQIDLSTLQGSGAHGRVTRRDVERAIDDPRATPATAVLPSPPTESVASLPAVPGVADERPSVPRADRAPLAGEDRALTPMRRAIAEHMTRARAEIPDAWSLIEIDMSKLVRYRQSVQDAWQASEGYELTYLPFFVKAVLAGLRAVPELNATYAGDHITLHRTYQLGIAVSVEQGLVVPVLRDADQLSVAGIARALRSIVQRARAGRLGLEDLQGATFTVNNPGSLGSVMSQPIVPVGQAGIVTMESILKRPVVTDDDAIAIRSMMNSCLSFDHRVLDGAGALTFLRTLKHHLETVEQPVY